MHTSDHDPVVPTSLRRTDAVALFAMNAEPLLTAREAAAYRRQGVSTFWRDVKEGRVPQPIRIAPKSPRWRLSDLCPQRVTCEASPQAAPTKRRSTHQK